MKLINKKVIDEIISPAGMVDAVEKAFRIYGKKAFTMPERFGVEHEGMTFLYMPCFMENLCGTKMLTLVPENRERNLPAIDGLVALNNRKTGQTEALLDGKSVTAWRTGATGALAARELSDERAARLGIVGCGVQGFYQGICISAVRRIERIRLFDRFKSKEELESFAERLRAACPEVKEITICHSAAELLAGSDVVVTTTFATEPVLPEEEELLRGKCYIAVGSYKPYMKELPDALFQITSDVYVDLLYACEESGDLSQRIEAGILDEKNVKCLHQVLGGIAAKPASDTVIFKTVGMALVDMVAADYLYQRAVETDRGMEVDF